MKRMAFIMKKLFTIVLAITCLICLVGCNSNSTQTPTMAFGGNYDITLSAKDISDTGLTLVLDNPSLPADAVSIGRYYSIQIYTDSEWKDLEPKTEPVFLTDAFVPMENTFETTVDWEQWYGQLPAGKYRISKNIGISFGTIGVSINNRTEDDITLWAEFEITE